MVAVKNANSTMHKVDTVHDPVFFEGDWDPNLQKEWVCDVADEQYIVDGYE
jgi:hypothetical protein